jgi:predicted amidohydrolase
LKIATAQTIVSSDIVDNGSAIRAMIANAAAEGARLINFCEGALSGYGKFQILKQDDWETFDWATQEAELRAIADLCRQLRIFAVVGGAHRLSEGYPPHNSLYVFSDAGTLLTRYDKRFLSNSELGGWYTPGTEPITFEVDGYRFGCAICIESQFEEVFSEYERLGVDGVLFSSYGIPHIFRSRCGRMRA